MTDLTFYASFYVIFLEVRDENSAFKISKDNVTLAFHNRPG